GGCKHGNVLSRPVLTADRLTAPPPHAPCSDTGRDQGLGPPTPAGAGAFPHRNGHPGAHTRGATPVPIPNTAVKPPGPMVVPHARESVGAGTIIRLLTVNHHVEGPRP